MSKININNMSATSDTIDCWEKINFDLAEKSVKKLQKRIAAAYLNDDYKLMINLQYKLIHSFYARVISIDVVTTNKGKYTSGIDNTLWLNPQDKFKAINDLKLRGYKHRPLKRIYIPKYNGELRPLGIPTIKDRAMQTLHKLALEPISEISADSNSFAFRHNRSTRDAILRCIDIFYQNPKSEWILQADIKSCFDNIDHEWILNNIPLNKEILKQFLKCGYVYDSKLYPTDKGVAQGSCISGMICNMVLDGLEKVVKDIDSSLNVIRYADDIVVIGNKDTVLKEFVVPVVERFLSERGLSLSKDKTKILNIRQGFTFLGYKIYKRYNQIISEPKRKSIDSLIMKIDEFMQCYPYLSDKTPYELLNLYQLLKMKIRGWVNYYNGIVTIQSIHGVEYEVVSYAYQRTGDKQIAKLIGKIFSFYD